MNTVHFLSNSLGRKPLLVLLVSVLILTLAMPHVAWPQANQANKQKIVQGVAQRWIQVGSEQYQRGMYKAAEQSFLFAKDYEAYLTVSQLEKLDELLEKSHNAVIERDSIIEKLALANELTEQNKPDQAKELFEQIKDNQFLTNAEKTQIAQKLGQLESKTSEEAARITELYNNSIKLYGVGKFEQARKGFLEVAKSGLISASPEQSPEDYLVIIDKILTQRLLHVPVVEEITQPEVESSITIDVAEDNKLLQTTKPTPERAAVVIDKKIVPETVQETYIDVVNHKRNILRSHTKAVVNSVIDQAQNCVNSTQFDEANQKVEDAFRIVNKNQIDIGEDLYELYLKQLKQLSELIANRRAEKQLQLHEQKRLEAIEAQRLYRDQTERERQRRIEELMENASAYQKQQRYEEALGQMESLLAIDPLNDHALILKQTLEDTIN
ncbi:MAG: hypothetical protein ACYSRR_02525, partial [Planctomycetota bacterium]